jgi:hypothetical protein
MHYSPATVLGTATVSLSLPPPSHSPCNQRRRSVTSGTLVAAPVLFYCAFSHHDHADDRCRDWRPLGPCGCCGSWVVPPPPAAAVACFGPLGIWDICQLCLDEYLPTGHIAAPAESLEVTWTSAVS